MREKIFNNIDELSSLLGTSIECFNCQEEWKSSMSTYPGDDLWFLQDTYLIQANQTLVLAEGALVALLQTAASLRGDINLCRLAWHYHRLIYQSSNYINPWTFRWPLLNDYFGETHSMFFNALVIISGLDKVITHHKKRGIPKKITVDTLSDLCLWMDNYYTRFGKWGFDQGQWFLFHFTGRLYRLGRLHFITENFTGKIKVFYNSRKKHTIALSETGIRYKSDGQVDESSNVNSSEGSWVSNLDINDKFIMGNPITRNGYAQEDMIKLSTKEWNLEFSNGDPVLDIHIPRDGKMSHEECGVSMNMAAEFFSRYFGETEYKAFTCETWLLNPQFQSLLPPSSNIVMFQREFYLFPVSASDSQTFDRVFGENLSDISKAPRETLLQRVIIDHVIAGGQLHHAGGFILKNDLNWGHELH